MNMVSDTCVIGIDLGGTKVLSSKIRNGKIVAKSKLDVPRNGTEIEVLEVLFQSIDKIINNDVSGIGIGVPSVVAIEKGIVYDVQNIPSWKEVHLGNILKERYNIPVFVNNDANCFAAGEKYFGKALNNDHAACVIIGTGMAAGLILNGKLYNGQNCGAGEFGMIPYLEHNFEYYASGQFFQNCHNISGEDLFKEAKKGNVQALEIYSEYGRHLGNGINAILYAIDPEIIILGGSVSKSFEFFRASLLEQIKTLAYSTVVENIKIECSTNPEIAVLGAASLIFNDKD